MGTKKLAEKYAHLHLVRCCVFALDARVKLYEKDTGNGLCITCEALFDRTMSAIIPFVGGRAGSAQRFRLTAWKW